MYNDKNRQNYHPARQAQAPSGLNCERCGRRCDGSLPLGAFNRPDNACNRADNACNRADDVCTATERKWGLQDYPLAMVYSPYQCFRNTYAPDIALDRGTLFSELDLPFEGYKGKRNGGCAR